MAQFLRKDCRKKVPVSESGRDNDSDKDTSHSISITRPLYEVTSSGMTHSWGSNAPYCGRANKSKLCTFYPFNLVVETVMRYAHFVVPWNALLQGNNDDRDIGVPGAGQKRTNNNRQLQYTLERNVAEVELDWKDSLVTLRILGDEGQTLLRQDWSMDRLTTTGGSTPSESATTRRRRTTTTTTTTTTCGAETLLDEASFETAQRRLESSLQRALPPDHGEYICVNYRGNTNRVHFALGVASTVGLGVFLGLCPVWVCVAFLALWIFRWRRRRRLRNCARQQPNTTSVAVDRPKTD